MEGIIDALGVILSTLLEKPNSNNRRGDRRLINIQVHSIDVYIKENVSVNEFMKALTGLVKDHNLSMKQKFKIKSLLWKKITRHNSWSLVDEEYGDWCSCSDAVWKHISESGWERDDDGIKYYHEGQIHHCPQKFHLDELNICIGMHPTFKQNKRKVVETIMIEL